MLIIEEIVRWREVRENMGNLYILLNITVNLKLLSKIKSIKKKTAEGSSYFSLGVKYLGGEHFVSKSVLKAVTLKIPGQTFLHLQGYFRIEGRR